MPTPIPEKPLETRLDTGALAAPAGSISLADPAFGGPLPLATGGTGATTPAQARTNLGLGSAAVLAAAAFDAAGAAASAQAAAIAASDPAGTAAALFATLTSGSPASLDTFLQTYNRFLSDESLESALNTTVAGKQPVNATLTAIAALASTSFGLSLLTAANAAALRALAGVGTTATTASVLKGDGAGNAIPASPGTDYVAPTGPGGTVPRSQLPNISGSYWQAVANQAAMLALSAPDPDTLLVVFRADQPGYIWFLNPGLSPATLSNWQNVQEDAAGAAAAVQSALNSEITRATYAEAGKAPVTTTTLDLTDVTMSAASAQLAVGVTSNVAPNGAYTSPPLPGAVGTPPARFAVKAPSTGGATVTYPNAAGTVETVTVLPGEALTFRQKTTLGWGSESGNKPLAQLDIRYVSAADSRLPWVQVLNADPTGATDSTAAIQAALNAIPTSGATVYLRGGNYLISGNLTCANPVKLVGDGNGGGANYSGPGTVLEATTGFTTHGTTLLYAKTTGVLLTLSGNGSIIQDIALYCSVTQTAGCGLLVNNANWMHFDRITVWGFYVNIHVVNGAEWTLTNSHIIDGALYGLWIESESYFDSGDQGVLNNWFGTCSTSITPAAYVYYQSGGGLRFCNNKINGQGNCQRGFWLSMAYNVNTSDLFISNNSFENVSGYAIEMSATANPSQFGNINIQGGNISICGGGIHIAAQGAGSCVGGYIGGIIFGSLSGRSIYLDSCAGFHVGTNTYLNCPTTLPLVHFGANTSNMSNSYQAAKNHLGMIIQDDNTSNPGDLTHDYRFSGVQYATGTTSTLCHLGQKQYTAGLVNFSLQGSVSGVGGFLIAGQYTFVRGTGTTAVELVSSITQGSAAGAAPTLSLTLNTSAVSGEVQMQLVNSTGATVFMGASKVSTDSTLASYTQGA